MNHVVLGHLGISNIYETLRRVNRYLKNKNIEKKVVVPSQLYVDPQFWMFAFEIKKEIIKNIK